MNSYVKLGVLGVLFLGVVSKAEGTAVEATYKTAICSKHLANAHRDTCKKRLFPKAVRACVQVGAGERPTLIEGSFEFEGYNGGNCLDDIGRVITYSCIAMFRCEK